MTKKHLQFCIYYMQTGDPQVAYKMTYPRAAVKSLGAASSRLMARPDVAEWVHGTEERVHNRMMRQFHSEHYDEFKEKLLTINEKRTVLTKIIKGETKRVRYVKVKYGVQKVEEDLSADAVLRAIDLDTRLENFYNYLTRSDTWRKTQNIYVNTPTLQQQVNILINQTTEKEKTKDVVKADVESLQKIFSPGRGVSEPGAEEGWVHSRRTDTQETVLPLGRGTKGDVLTSNTPESQTESPRNLYRPGRDGDRDRDRDRDRGKTHAQVTPESDNTCPLQETPTPIGSRVLSPAACPDDFGSGGVKPVTGAASASGVIEHSRWSDNTSPRPGDLGVHSRRTDNTNPDSDLPIVIGIRGSSRRTNNEKKTPRFLTTVNNPSSPGVRPKHK